MYQRLQPPGNVSPAFFLSLSFCCTVLLAVAVRTLPTGYSPSRRFVCVDVQLKCLDWCLLRPVAPTPVSVAASADLGPAAPADGVTLGFPVHQPCSQRSCPPGSTAG